MKGFKVFIFFTIIAAIVAAIIYFKDKLKAISKEMLKQSAPQAINPASIPTYQKATIKPPVNTPIPLHILYADIIQKIKDGEAAKPIETPPVISPPLGIIPSGEILTNTYPQNNGHYYNTV